MDLADSCRINRTRARVSSGHNVTRSSGISDVVPSTVCSVVGKERIFDFELKGLRVSRTRKCHCKRCINSKENDCSFIRSNKQG